VTDFVYRRRANSFLGKVHGRWVLFGFIRPDLRSNYYLRIREVYDLKVKSSSGILLPEQVNSFLYGLILV
jgi:hypothetical protein